MDCFASLAMTVEWPRERRLPQSSSPGLTGRPSIPETAVIESRSRGVLDTRFRGYDVLGAGEARAQRPLPQPQLLIPLRRHLIAPCAIPRCAAAVAGDDAGLLALDVGIDAGHPGIDLVGQQAFTERLDVIGPGFHALGR